MTACSSSRKAPSPCSAKIAATGRPGAGLEFVVGVGERPAEALGEHPADGHVFLLVPR